MSCSKSYVGETIEIIVQRGAPRTVPKKDAAYFPSTKTLYSNYEVSPEKWPQNKLQPFSPKEKHAFNNRISCSSLYYQYGLIFCRGWHKRQIRVIVKIDVSLYLYKCQMCTDDNILLRREAKMVLVKNCTVFCSSIMKRKKNVFYFTIQIAFISITMNKVPIWSLQNLY